MEISWELHRIAEWFCSIYTRHTCHRLHTAALCVGACSPLFNRCTFCPYPKKCGETMKREMKGWSGSGLFLSSVAKIQHHVETSVEEMGLPVCQSWRYTSNLCRRWPCFRQSRGNCCRHGKGGNRQGAWGLCLGCPIELAERIGGFYTSSTSNTRASQGRKWDSEQALYDLL